MENQPRPRPWFRLPSLARPMGPPPDPSSRPRMQRPAALLPRPTIVRPTFRPPIVTQPQSAQGPAPPFQTPRPQAPPPRLPSVTTPVPTLPLPPALVSPMSPSKSLPRIATTSPVVQNPVTQKSPNASPVSRKSPLSSSPVTPKSPLSSSPVTQKSPLMSPDSPKYPSAPGASPISSTIPSPSPLPSSPKPKTHSPLPLILPSPAIIQTFSPTKQVISLPVPNILIPSNALLSTASNSPVPTPRSVKPLPETPPESPKIKPALDSPPLFSLPPSQLKSDGEYERYIPAVAEQKAVRNPRSLPQSYHNHPENGPVRIRDKPKHRETKGASVSEDIGRKGVITISGENIGAVMELGYSRRTHSNPHTAHSPVSRYQKLRNDGKLSEGNLRGIEGKSKIQDSNHTPKARPSTPMHALTNSNVQGVNGSIVFNSTLSHHDPGVHLSVAMKPVKSNLKEHHIEQNLFRMEA